MKTNQELDALFQLWFNTESSELLDGWPLTERDEGYYVNKFYEEIIFELPLPKEGKILVLGTHNCVSFDKLCHHFGYDRCIGYDLFNPKKHPSVVIKDCEELKDDDKLELAFCHNDIGSFWKTPELKLHCQEWAAKKIVKGGYFLGNNNYNRPRIELEKRMENFRFQNVQLSDKKHFPPSKVTLSNDILQGYMLSKKK